MAMGCLLCFLVLCCFLLLISVADEKCPQFFHCGNLGDSIHFPFTNTTSSDCGLPIIGCNEEDEHQMVQLGNKKFYQIKSIAQDNSFSIIIDHEFHEPLCPENSTFFDNKDTLLPVPSPVMSFQINMEHNTTLFRFKHDEIDKHPLPEGHFLLAECHDYSFFYFPSPPAPFSPALSVFQLPARVIGPIPGRPIAPEFIAEFTIEVVLSEDCHRCYHRRGGECRVDDKGKFHCAKAKVSAALGVGVLIIIIYCFRRKFWKEKSRSHLDFEAFLKNNGPLGVRRYSYLDIKKMTNSFKEKLGQGGYGGVFKGKLQHDDSLVAVKVLNKSKGNNGEEFINEVASISITSHVNIVTLIGFSFEGSKRTLIYEFMPNGSLEKFIYGTNPMGCDILYQIAIGVAQGLEYLHRGCNTRIFHFDIKPHNILLDENFRPKISDFGLAKICPRNESMVSMLGARGTPGYIAPEVFSRNFRVVSHKSDVYSFGMMVLEMVGGRKNVNVEVDCTSEIYFPRWIYKRVELNEDLALRNIANESDRERMRKMVIVSLWCIQTDPTNRPTMHNVVEMLEGNIETLQIPPKPFLSSPSRSPPCYSSANWCNNSLY